MSETKSATSIVTGLVRFSYAKVFEAYAMNEGDTPKYSVCILIKKSDKATLTKIAKAIEAAKQQGKTSKWGGKIPRRNFREPLRDGDEERDDLKEYEGMYFLNANSRNRVSIVDVDLNDIIDKEDFYSGCWGRASLNFFPYDTNGKGVGVGLNGLQKLKDGEALSGGRFDPEEAFGDNFKWDDDEDEQPNSAHDDEDDWEYEDEEEETDWEDDDEEEGNWDD